MNMFNKYENKNLFFKAIDILKEKGAINLSLQFYRFSKQKLFFLLSPMIILLKKDKFFLFENKKLKYFYHGYNATWTNGRCIEVPIIMSYIQNGYNSHILEFGSVLPHYYPVRWDVLDKFEIRKKVINEDVIDFYPSNKYNLIVSISTLEHVGFDDDNKDPEKPLKAVLHLKEHCLENNGKMIFTVPIGYNPSIDFLLFKNNSVFNKKYYFRNYPKKGWIEISEEIARNTNYDYNSEVADTIGIVIVDK